MGQDGSPVRERKTEEWADHFNSTFVDAGGHFQHVLIDLQEWSWKQVLY